jgi:hypothetical protein
VTDSGVAIDDGARLVHVAHGLFRVVNVRGVGRFEQRSTTSCATIAERLRPLSRFPQGLTPELERRYLAARR